MGVDVTDDDRGLLGWMLCGLNTYHKFVERAHGHGDRAAGETGGLAFEGRDGQ